MPKYTITARNAKGETKTLKITADTLEDALATAQAENPRHAFTKPVIMQEPFRVSGPFIHRTFISKAIAAGYSESEAVRLFETMLRDGRVFAHKDKIGLLNEANKFEMK